MRIILIIGISAALARAQTQTLEVAADGSSQFATIQAALATVKPSQLTEIHIKPGTYHGPIAIEKGQDHVTLRGDDATTTKILWDQWASFSGTTQPANGQFNPGVHVYADDFTAANLTFENTYGDHGQALALRMDGDRETIRHCRIIGWQDTLMVNNGRDYFEDCMIAGRVDFIYGSATAWFENCEIHSRNGGHITAASTPQDHPFGFVFNRCKLTGDATPWAPPAGAPVPEKSNTAVTPLADLGRPWRPYASVTFLHCELGSHIKPEGWNSWLKKGETVSPNEKTARYAEFESTGPGASPDKRLPWTRQLTSDEAKAIKPQAVLAGKDGWKPGPATLP